MPPVETAAPAPATGTAGAPAANPGGYSPPVDVRVEYGKYLTPTVPAEGGPTGATAASGGTAGASGGDEKTPFLGLIPKATKGNGKASEPKASVPAKGATAATEPKVEASISELQALAKEGKFDEVVRKLGLDPDGMKVPSSRYAEFRKFEIREKAKLAQAAEVITREKAEVQALAKQTVAQVEPLIQAKKAWDDGNIEHALKLAFGADLEKFSEAAMKQKLGEDPRVTRLERELEQRRKADEETAETRRKAEAEQVEAGRKREYLAALTVELKQGSEGPEGRVPNPIIVAACEVFNDFPEQVMRLQLETYNQTREELTPEEAAGTLLERIRPWLDRWQKVLGAGSQNSETSVEAATEPPDTIQAGKSPVKPPQKGPKVQPAPPKPVETMSESERMAHYTKLMQAAAREDGLA
jgi:hypothetical protein